MNLAEQIRKVRLEKAMTQEEVAKNLFVARQTVSRWETGATIPPLNALYDLSDLYQLSISELLGEKIIMKKKVSGFALLGSLVFNFLFLSTFGILFVALWLAAWMIAIMFVGSPFLLVWVNITGVQAFAWDQTVYTLGVIIIGLIAVSPLKKLSIFLYQATKNYFRYNFNSVFYTITDED